MIFALFQAAKASTPVTNVVGRSSPAGAAAPQNKTTKARKKEEENLQKVFNQNQPKDEFTSWCATTLATMDSQVEKGI